MSDNVLTKNDLLPDPIPQAAAQQQSGTRDFDWPELQPPRQDLLPVEPFPIELLPESLRSWVQDTSLRMDNAPCDYAAVGAMCGLGALLGRKVGIHPKQQDDWLVVANLWGVVIGRPSTKKTPSLSEATKPLARLEIAAKEQHQAEEAEHQRAMRLQAMRCKDAERKAQQAIKQGHDDIAEKHLRDADADAPSMPTRRRLVVNNATVEKLGEILSENPTGVLQFRDELTGWLKSMDRDDRGEDRAFYLEAWNGLGSFTYDRIGRGTVDIPSTTVSVLGGIQPGKLQPYLMAQRDGAGDDGFIERLQLMVYPNPNTFKHVDQWPDSKAKDRAYSVFHAFADIPPGGDDMPSLRFTEEAQALFNEWYCDLMSRCRAGVENQHIESHLSKYASLMPSLALIIHVAEQGPSGDVGLRAAKQAAAWCEYLESHARRVYALANDPLAGPRVLIDRLEQLTSPFTAREVQRKQWSCLYTKGDVEAALLEITRRGYAIREEAPAGTKTKTVYHTNPEVSA